MFFADRGWRLVIQGPPTANDRCIVIGSAGRGPFIFEEVQGVVDTLKRLLDAIL
jgi:hypothetical protein